MSRHHLIRFAAALTLLFTVAGCTTTSQPVAQANAAKSKAYVTEDTPQTGSHIARRYSVDDPQAAAASSTATMSGDAIGNFRQTAPRGN